MKLKIHRTEEELLIQKCRQSERQAQHELYAKYASKMHAISLRYVKDEAEAEDVTITAFVKIFEKINQYKGEGSFEGWMRRVVVNQALGYIRKNKSMYLEVDIEKADYEPDYSTLGTQLEAEDLLNLVQQLPIGYQTVFNLYAIEGYSHKEISDQLGITENTSKSQLSRARALLQKKLTETEAVLKNKIN